jgi:lipid-A-disaccharide synthase-like uncharacterized protein
MNLYNIYKYGSFAHSFVAITSLIIENKFKQFNIAHCLISISFFLRNKKFLKTQPILYNYVAIMGHSILSYVIFKENNIILFFGQIGMIIHYIMEIYIYKHHNKLIHTKLDENPVIFNLYNIIIYLILSVSYILLYLKDNNNSLIGVIILYVSFLLITFRELN